MDDLDQAHRDQQKLDSNRKLIQKLKIKLKLLKQTPQSPLPPPPPPRPHPRHQDRHFEQLAYQKSDHQNSDLRVFCPTCKKGFANPKALGGHLRVHKPKPIPDLNSDPGMGFDPVSCDICQKEFPSQKALFGHMRAHPDREWRGMRSPEGSNPGRIPRWGVKGKRGRINPRVGAEVQAAVDLMLLVNDDVGRRRGEERKSLDYFSPVLKKRVGEFDADELYFLQNLGDCYSGSSHDDQANPRKEEEEEENNGNGKRVRVRVSTNEENHENEGRRMCRWVCTSCDRTFHSHQALGGHRSSCNKIDKE